MTQPDLKKTFDVSQKQKSTRMITFSKIFYVLWITFLKDWSFVTVNTAYNWPTCIYTTLKKRMNKKTENTL